MPRMQETLAGRYELSDVLGRGGMGIVYRARDRVLHRTVAVKVLLTEYAADPTFVTRFQREARAAASLSHPNIVAVFDSGHDADTRFIVMECAPGISLAQLLRREGRLPVPRAVQIAQQVADALAAAHAAGIVHRDVKPANVMVEDWANVKVLDFGIARAAADTSITRTAIVLGSAPYLAPEVTRGEPADERSDVYSLGCVLYEMLAGQTPFTGEVSATVMHQHNTVPPRPVSELNPDVPAALEATVTRMLAKRSQARPQTAREVVGALGGSRTELRPHPTLPATEPTRTMRRTWRLRRGERLALAAAAILVLAGAALALLVSSGSSPHPSAKTPATRPTSVRSAPGAANLPAAPLSVRAAAAGLTSLITRDLRSGGVDPRAGGQLLARLQDVLVSYQSGNAGDALSRAQALTTAIAGLAHHGDVKPSALPAIEGALGALRAALVRAAVTQTTTAASPPTPNQGAPGKRGKGHGDHGGGGGD